MIVHPKYPSFFLLLVFCYLQATQSISINTVITETGPERNNNLVDEAATISNCQNDGLHVHKNSDIFEDKESPEEYIERILNPLESTRFKRKWPDIPVSQQEKQIFGNQMVGELSSLLENVKTMMVNWGNSRTTFPTVKESVKEGAPKLEEIHQHLLILENHKLAILRGRLSHMSIAGTNQPDPMSHKPSLEKLKPNDFNVIFGQKENFGKTSSTLNNKELTETVSKSDEEMQEYFIPQDIQNQFMQKMGKNLAKEIMDLIQKTSHKRFSKSFPEDPIHRIGFQTIYFMYWNHLISKQDFVSLFDEVTLGEAAENMFHNYIYDQKYLFGISHEDDFKNIFNGWYASPDREMFSALEPSQQRMFSFYSLKIIFRKYRNLSETQRSPELEEVMFDLEKKLFDNNTRFNLLERMKTTSRQNLEGIEELKMDLKTLTNTFENHDLNHPTNEFTKELLVLFQFIRFIKENYPKLEGSILEKGETFEKKYALVNERSQFNGKLDNIQIYLTLKFGQKTPSPLVVELYTPVNKESSMEPLDELKHISKHIDHLFSQHNQVIDAILEGEEKTMNGYCVHENIKHRISFLKKTIAGLEDKLAI